MSKQTISDPQGRQLRQPCPGVLSSVILWTCFLGLVVVWLPVDFAVVTAADPKPSWQAVAIVRFTDFDDMQIKLDGKETQAFLVGLGPLRDSVKEKDMPPLRKEIVTKLAKNALAARVVTQRGEAIGLLLDTFMHHKNDFGHPWDPNKYPYCWSGWGAYNFNTYFLQTKTGHYQDNFGDNKPCRDEFAEIVCTIRDAERVAILIQDLGHEKFAKREAASKELKNIGGPALQALRMASSSSDLEIRRRAEQIIQALIAMHQPQIRQLAEHYEVDEQRVLAIFLSQIQRRKSSWTPPAK